VPLALIARGEHLRAIRERGLRLESIAGDALVHPAIATADPGAVGTVDAVLVATKTWQLPEAARTMRPLVGAETVVVPLLNGVEAPEVLTEALGAEPVLGGLSGMFSFIAGPGHIRHVGAEPWVTLGELEGGLSERVRRLAAILERCRGLQVHPSEDIRVAMWEKFMFITATGGVGAVTRSPYGAFRAVRETRDMVEAAMREVVAVARARGIGLSERAISERMRFIDSLEPHGTTSMQRDMDASKRSELDEWNGAVVRLGRERGVETAVHAYIYASLLPRELRARGDLEFPEAR
ncbi:MAG TPA: 2-dehydropantoate 2-reductase, partial [Actinomycetota bacterium]|nr:2-dehydropantoate 2-reductase [Actinomycetota bacterium]